MLHHSTDALFIEVMQYTAPDAADEVIFNEHLFRDIIAQPKPTPTKKESETSKLTRDCNSKRQMEEPLDDESCLQPKKQS